MKSDLVVRGLHNPTRFNAHADVRARMFRGQRLWLATRRVAAVLAGDLNTKHPWTAGKRVKPLHSHSVDHIWGNDGWAVIDRRVVELKKYRLSDHDAVRVVLRHRETGQILVVATVNLKHHWANPGTRARKIMTLLDADVVVCNEMNEAQYRSLVDVRGLRVHRGLSNSLRGGWTGNAIVWKSARVMSSRRRNRPVAYVYLKGKKRSRRPRIPVPTVNWSPIVWFAFVPTKER